MSTRNEKIKVTDKSGFHYEVLIEHKPHFGFSTALYEGQIIGQVELGRILEPIGDDDYEWECYEERFAKNVSPNGQTRLKATWLEFAPNTLTVSWQVAANSLIYAIQFIELCF
jgi:hypothetical protein